MAVSQPSPRIGLFIDGPDLHATSRALGFDVDFKRLLWEFSSLGSSLRAFYYTTVSGDQANCPARRLVDWLDYNGYTVVTKVIREFTGAGGRRKIKSNTNVELAVDAIRLAEQFDQIVLFSGDGDFRPLVEAVQRRGVRVIVASTALSQPAMIADELRRQADAFIELAALRLKLCRNTSEH
jgi:uncharacterized LabA/DUF88 family protein